MTVQSWSQTLQYAEGHLTQCCQGLAQRSKSISSSNLYGTKPTWPCWERSWLPFPCQLTFRNEVREVAFISKAVASLENVSLQGLRYKKQDPPPFHVQTLIIILSDIYNMLSSVLWSPQLLRTLIKSQSVHFELQKHNSKLCIAYIAYIALMIDKGQASLHGKNSEIWYIYTYIYILPPETLCMYFIYINNACIY